MKTEVARLVMFQNDTQKQKLNNINREVYHRAGVLILQRP